MKKFFWILIFAMMAMLSACGEPTADYEPEGIINIRERFFAQHIREIYASPDDNLGRTIRLEGMFFTRTFQDTGERFHVVTRGTVTCCGNRGEIGFEVVLGDREPFPDDTWVQVTGVLQENETYGFLYLAVSSVIETERGETEVFAPH